MATNCLKIAYFYKAETRTLTKSDEQKIESFQMSCFIRRILGIRWCDFVPNVSVMNQTQQQSICNRIRNRRVSIFGHVPVPAHEALRLVVNSRAGHRPDDRQAWKRPRGRPRQTWIRQLEIDVGLTADAAFLIGTWLEIATSGGRNDPSPVKRSNEWVSEWTIQFSLN